MLLYGDRIGQLGKIVAGCCAAIFDDGGQKILLTRRTDNALWCLPGGRMEPGETVAEACIREVFEETGLQVALKRLIGVYSNPHSLVQYADGSRTQPVSICFEAVIVAGTMGPTNETTEIGFFGETECAELDLLGNHPKRVADAFARHTDAVFD